MALFAHRTQLALVAVLSQERASSTFITLSEIVRLRPCMGLEWAPLLVDDEHPKVPFFYELWIGEYLECDFYAHFRMTRQTFDLLSAEVRPHFARSAKGVPSVPLEKALMITLWYWAKGDVLISIADRFNVAVSTVHDLVGDIISCIDQLMPLYIKWPTMEESASIKRNFEDIAGFPGVIGAIDGCHFTCTVPADQHDSYQDRHLQHSVTMQASVTRDKLLTNISVGYPGSLHDARILRESHLYQVITQHGAQQLFSGTDTHLVGDSAYPCEVWLMTPYRNDGRLNRSQRNYNKILSKTRVVVENTFALIKGRWRITQHINVYSIKRAVSIITCCSFLHNFCLANNDFFDMELEEPRDEDIEGLFEDHGAGIGKRNAICTYLINNNE